MRIISSGMSPKKRQRVTWWKTSRTCSISSQYDRELTASVGIVSVHLRLKDSKIFIFGGVVDYQLAKSSTKTLRHLRK